MAGQKFRIRTKHIPLSFMGEEWVDAYVEARLINVADNRHVMELLGSIGDDNAKALEASQDVVQQQFVAGKAPDMNGALSPFTREDIPAIFDAAAIMELYSRVMGNPDPKASESSTTSTLEETTENPESAPCSDTDKPLDSVENSLTESHLTTTSTG